MANREDPVERGMLGEAAHPLERDPGLVTTGGADRHRSTGNGEEMMEADQRRGRGLRVAAREDRADLPRGPEVRTSYAFLVRVQRLVDHLAQRRESRKSRDHARRVTDRHGAHCQ